MQHIHVHVRMQKEGERAGGLDRIWKILKYRPHVTSNIQYTTCFMSTCNLLQIL
jgi:hypothetical protein